MSWDQLRIQIDRHLDLEELRTLCFDLGVDYDSLRGEGKAAKIRELIALLRRNNRVPQLIVALNVIRPHVQWNAIQLDDVNVAPVGRRSMSLWLISGGVVVLVALAGLVMANGPSSIALFSPTPTNTPPPTAQPTTAPTIAIPTSTIQLPTNTVAPATTAPTVEVPTPAPPTNTLEPPHAPPIENTFGTELYDERVILLTIPSGGKEVLRIQELWSAPFGTPVSCVSGFLAFTWMVRDPYPTGGEGLEFWQLIPQSDGRTDILTRGASGASTVAYCQELTVTNTSLVDYRIEIRYASGTYE
jgi:hypothetical protein